jgi:hypothetical protein
MRAADTSPKAEQVRLGILRAKAPEQRLLDALELSEAARELTKAGIRSRHPDYTPRQVELALFRLLYGPALADNAWPESTLLSP